MRPATSQPWRKTLRREAKGIDTGRHATGIAQPTRLRRGSSWLRRHLWMPDSREEYQRRLGRPTPSVPAGPSTGRATLGERSLGDPRPVGTPTTTTEEEKP